MVAPTITYGHGAQDDTFKDFSTAYTFVNGGSTAAAAVNSNRDLAIAYTTYVEDVYVRNTNSFNISASVYTKILVRYRVTGNIRAAVGVVIGGVEQTVLAKASGTATAWTTISATLNTGTISYVKLYACNPAAGAVGGEVQYDFYFICKNIFSIPQYATLSWSKSNRYNSGEVPGRIGRRKAWHGANETLVTISGDIDDLKNDGATPTPNYHWKRSGDTLAAVVFDDIHHNASTETWQWFTSDRASFKVVMENLDYTETADQNYLYSFTTTLSEYAKVNLANYTVNERINK